MFSRTSVQLFVGDGDVVHGADDAVGGSAVRRGLQSPLESRGHGRRRLREQLNLRPLGHVAPSRFCIIVTRSRLVWSARVASLSLGGELESFQASETSRIIQPRGYEVIRRSVAMVRTFSTSGSGRARRASTLLKHVSDPTRLQVILIFAEGELSSMVHFVISSYKA